MGKATTLNVSLPDTLKLKDVTPIKSDESPIYYMMPWLVALFIGIVSAGVNYIISNRLKIANEKNLQVQIKNSKEITLTQFKATIGTKNRQDWINEIRHELSELIANEALFGFEKIEDIPSKDNLAKYLHNIEYSRAKVEMLLNNQKPEQIRLLKAIKNLIEEGTKITKDDHNTENSNEAKREIIQAARELFSIHWKKIKALE